MMFGMSKAAIEEETAKKKTRAQITEVRDIVLVDHAKLCVLHDSFDAHLIKGEATVDKIFKVIDNLDCPKEETIRVLEAYKHEQNGCLNELKKQALEQKDTLNALVNQNKGEDKAKDKRNRRITLWVSVIGVALVFGALFFQIYDMKKSSLSHSAVLEYKMQQLEEKK